MTEFGDPILAGNTLIRDAIQSENFVQGSTGWRIERDGNAEFYNITARGDVVASRLQVEDATSGARLIADPNAVPWLDGMHISMDPGESPDGENITLFGEIRAVWDPGIPNLPQLDIITPSMLNREPASIEMQGESLDGSENARISLWTLSTTGAGAFIGLTGGSPRALIELGASPTFTDTQVNGRLQASRMRPTETHNTTLETITSTSFSGLGYGHSFEAPNSGTVDVEVWAFVGIEPSDSGRKQIWTSFEIREGTTVGSGSVVLGASAFWSVSLGIDQNSGGDERVAASARKLVDGLTPGADYNVQIMHRCLTTSSVTNTEFGRRVITTPCL